MAVFVFVLLLVCIGVPSSSAGNSNTEFTFKQRVLEDIADLTKAAEKKFVVTNQWLKDTALGALRLLVNCEPIFASEEKQSLSAIGTGIGNILSTIPEAFSSVEKWPECKDIIEKVPGIWVNNCTLGWVLAFAKTLSDRTCITSKGKVKVEFSPADILKNCRECCNDPEMARSGVEAKSGNAGSISNGGNVSISVGPHCWGGNAATAWRHWANFGVVTGGFSRDSYFLDCLPLFSIFTFFFNDSIQHQDECFYDKQVRKKSAIPNYQDEIQKYKPRNPQVYTLHGEEQIQSDIIQHGPVQAGMDLYEDFFLYKSGVYSHTSRSQLVGFHSVTINGWGNHNGEKYWIVVNPWGKEFGDDGHVWILRGSNECNIESYVIAGIDAKPRGASVPPTSKQDKSKDEKKKSDEKSSAILIAPCKIFILAIIGSFVMYFV